MIEEYQSHFAYWCSEPDKGIYNAMNKGISKAQGDYCLFLNSGDYLFNENVIERAALSLKDYDFIAGDTIYVSENGKTSYGQSPRIFSSFYVVNYTLSHQSLFINTKLLKKRPYREDLKIVSDWEQYVYELVLCDATYLCLPFVVSCYMEGGFSFVHDQLLHEEREIVRQELFSKNLLGAIRGDNEMKAIVNHIGEGSVQYKICLFAIRAIRKICMWLKLN